MPKKNPQTALMRVMSVVLVGVCGTGGAAQKNDFFSPPPLPYALSAKRIFLVCPSFSGPPTIFTGF